jgi:hypothetical protein
VIENTIAVEASDATDARARLFSKLDEVAERLDAHERERFFVSRLIASAAREFEGQRRLDPTNEDDHKAILDAVQRAITPRVIPYSVAGDGEDDVAEHVHAGGAVPFEPEAAE